MHAASVLFFWPFGRPARQGDKMACRDDLCISHPDFVFDEAGDRIFGLLRKKTVNTDSFSDWQRRYACREDACTVFFKAGVML